VIPTHREQTRVKVMGAGGKGGGVFKKREKKKKRDRRFIASLRAPREKRKGMFLFSAKEKEGKGNRLCFTGYTFDQNISSSKNWERGEGKRTTGGGKERRAMQPADYATNVSNTWDVKGEKGRRKEGNCSLSSLEEKKKEKKKGNPAGPFQTFVGKERERTIYVRLKTVSMESSI